MIIDKFIKKLLLICILWSSLTGEAQSKIFGLDPWLDSTNQRMLVSYDYVNNIYDTVLKLPNGVGYVNLWNSIDPYNGRYFFLGYQTGSTGYKLFTVDLNTYTYTILSLTQNIINYGEIKYDMFENKLVFPSSTNFKSMDLSNATLSTLFSSTLSSGSGGGVYNNLEQIYLAFVCCSPPSDYFITYDISNKNVLDTTQVSNNSCNGGLVFDISNKEYYCMINNDGTIAKINPFTGQKNIICKVPAWGAWLNREQAVFDSKNGLYILPYSSTSNQSRIAVIDVSTGLITNDYIFPGTDFTQIYPKYRPAIKKDSKGLTATWGLSYQWYLNDSLIMGATSQTYVPKDGGLYKVKVTFMGDRSDYSDEVYILVTGIKLNSSEIKNIVVYPNPFHSSATISFGNKASDFCTIDIYNCSGQLAQKIKDISSGEYTIESHNLKEGAYFFLIKNAYNFVIGKGKFIIN